MSGSVHEEYDALVKALSESNYTKEESLQIVSEYVHAVIKNNVPLSERKGAAMTAGDFVKRVRNHDWKFPHGFFGYWAENAEA